jgi:uncharacterized protein YjbJ (UPF0337 family)
MAGKTDEAKGRTKKAAGELTGNKSLADRGRADKAKGKVKKGADKSANKVKKGIRKAS